MNIWQSLAGELEAELLTADPAGALCAIARANIPLSQVTLSGELTLVFRLSRRDYGRLHRLVAKRGEKLTICHRLGTYWTVKGLVKRPLLVFGMTVFLMLSLWLPTRIFFFRVEGNRRLSSREIIAAAEQCGVSFGISRKRIRSEKIKNNLLSQLPELKWAGINTHGCVAVIHVEEKPETTPMEPGNAMLCHIVAARDGIVTALTATAGTPLCSPGQAVVEGQILISGLTDCGIALCAQTAQGEVTALTSRQIRTAAPEKQLRRSVIQKKIHRWSLILGKKRIKLWIGSGIWDTGCGRMYREYPLCLPGGFQLPVALAVDTLEQSALVDSEILPEDAQLQLHAFAESSLRQAMLGGTLCKATETISREQGVYLLTGSYSCREVISRPRWEQIGETHE